MDIIIIILCALSLFISMGCLFYLIKLHGMQTDGKESERTEEMLKELKESLYNEFSRNRGELQTQSKLQRDEVSSKLKDIYERVGKLTESNAEYLRRISSELNRQLTDIRDSSATLADKQNIKIETALERIRQSNEKKLDEMRGVVDEKLTNTLTQRLDTSFKTVSEQLENLYRALGEMKEMSSGITDNVSVLNRVLSNVKARGTWAEVQLKNILDQTIPGMYVENFAPEERSRERVEFAIKIPSADSNGQVTYLPVDSKVPVGYYIRLCDAADRADPEGVAKARHDLEERVLKEAKDIKKYIQVPKTTPFAIMYLASEGLYAEIASSPSGLPEKLQNSFGIMIAGPTTVTALLNSLAMGFKIAAINEKATEVRKLLSAVKSQYDTFGNLLQKAGKKIDEAKHSLEEAQHRNDMIQKKLKSVESVSPGESDTLLEISASQPSSEKTDNADDIM